MATPQFNGDFSAYTVLNSLVTFFREAAVGGYQNLLPYGYQLLAAFLIIDLAITWTLYKGDFKIQEIFEKICKVGFLLLILKMMPEINFYILRSFQQAGLIAAGLNTDVNAFVNPANILSKGIEIIGVVAGGNGEYGGVLAEVMKVGFFTKGGLGILFMGIITIILVVFSFFMMAVELMMTIIEFNVFASVAVILVPFAGLKFTSFLFQRCVSAVFQYGIKFLVLYFVLGLVWNISKDIGPISAKEGQALDVGTMLTFALTYLTLGYLVMKIPNLVSGMLSGQPSMSGNGVASTIGGMAMGAAMTTATLPARIATGAASAYGRTRAVLAASKVDGSVSGKAVASNIGGMILNKNPITQAKLRGADSTIESMRMRQAVKNRDWTVKTDEQIKQQLNPQPTPEQQAKLAQMQNEIAVQTKKFNQEYKNFNNQYTPIDFEYKPPKKDN
ncbi:type IV secretion system protein [Veillonella sp.]|uniref:type IV secretion system protein n=1 Tax=Veillonella sp. TaxID=1926307 RepID=UPI0025D54DD2|nr:type IV secretion system protein [Veillonella sp.]